MATSRHHTEPEFDQILMTLAPEIAPRPSERAASPDLDLSLAVLERERREFHLELLEAGHVQRRLSGPRQLSRGVFDIAGEVFPARYLAGDFVSVMDVGERTWIFLGDIAGKGVAAAMWFTHLVSLIRCHAIARDNTAVVMAAVNRELCALRPAPPITSMVLLRLDWHSDEVEYCNAGHPPALLLRRDSGLERLETGGPVLGVVAGAGFESARIALRPGDMLLGCSDGVLECRNQSDEEFGNARFQAKAREHAGEPAHAVLFSILGGLQDFATGMPRQDDVSLLVIRHTGAAQRS
jgi:serine phosphatase RsbU (regulator of sigma subunit)